MILMHIKSWKMLRWLAEAKRTHSAAEKIKVLTYRGCVPVAVAKSGALAHVCDRGEKEDHGDGDRHPP
jgi:hypothetical protein